LEEVVLDQQDQVVTVMEPMEIIQFFQQQHLQVEVEAVVDLLGVSLMVQESQVVLVEEQQEGVQTLPVVGLHVKEMTEEHQQGRQVGQEPVEVEPELLEEIQIIVQFLNHQILEELEELDYQIILLDLV
tara:strand:+ start:245 stop:631 length:387 start_codon:yes stop_codon:yes gene_type:complete